MLRLKTYLGDEKQFKINKFLLYIFVEDVILNEIYKQDKTTKSTLKSKQWEIRETKRKVKFHYDIYYLM